MKNFSIHTLALGNVDMHTHGMWVTRTQSVKPIPIQGKHLIEDTVSVSYKNINSISSCSLHSLSTLLYQNDTIFTFLGIYIYITFGVMLLLCLNKNDIFSC